MIYTLNEYDFAMTQKSRFELRIHRLLRILCQNAAACGLGSQPTGSPFPFPSKALTQRARTSHTHWQMLVEGEVVRGNNDWNCPSCQTLTIVTICMSYFTTGDPGKEHGTNKPSPTGRIQENSKGDSMCPTTSQNLHWNPSWLSNACATKKHPDSEGVAGNNPETNPIPIKPKTERHVVEQPCWVPLTFLLSAWVPFSNKFPCFVRTCVSSDDSFLRVRQEYTFGLWKGSLFLQHRHLGFCIQSLSSLHPSARAHTCIPRSSGKCFTPALWSTLRMSEQGKGLHRTWNWEQAVWLLVQEPWVSGLGFKRAGVWAPGLRMCP